MPEQPPPAASPPRAVRIAAVIAAVQGAALAGLGLFEAGKTAFGRPTSSSGGLAVAVLALAGAVVLVLLARGLARGRGWSRSPMIVLQLLALPVGYSLAVPSGQPVYGVPVLILAAAELYLLFTPEAREALERPPPRF